MGFFRKLLFSCDMNLQLRFSWAHIIAFIGLIFIAYVVFMGKTYSTLGNYLIAGIYASIAVLSLGLTIIGAQILKGAASKFYKSIIWERVLLFLSVPALFVTFIPYNQFWNVQAREQEITENFKISIQGAHDIFSDYENYAKDRIAVFEQNCKRAPRLKQNRVDELSLVLLSENFTNMRVAADGWIDKASVNSSVWNVFLFGNLENMASAIDSWTLDLYEMSKKRIGAENYEVAPFSMSNKGYIASIQGLDGMRNLYTVKKSINMWAVITILILYSGMLLLPYYIQERNARNCERFWDFWPFTLFYEEKNTEEIHVTKKSDNRKTGKGAPV